VCPPVEYRNSTSKSTQPLLPTYHHPCSTSHRVWHYSVRNAYDSVASISNYEIEREDVNWWGPRRVQEEAVKITPIQ
jgi:hypothetical protein